VNDDAFAIAVAVLVARTDDDDEGGEQQEAQDTAAPAQTVHVRVRGADGAGGEAGGVAVERHVLHGSRAARCRDR
jgi:hypothetical protein